MVIAVIFIFLRSFRATLIPFVTIPVSLIGAFIFLHLFGFTINVLTLLGLVVDDAIVMLENIHRHIEAGMEPMEAALKGSKEIAFAVMAMTLTLVAVFLPLAFATGNTGKLFTEFALTVASAVLVSGFVALTLTPMMCSRILRHEKKHGKLYNTLESFFNGMNNGYRRLLGKTLRHHWLVGGVFVLVGAVAVGVGLTLKSELSPLEDRSFFIGLIIAPDGATMNYTERYARNIEAIYKQDIPEVDTFFMVVAPGLERPNPVNTALSFVRLKPWEQRTRSQVEIAQAIGPKLFMQPGVLAFIINPPSLGQSFRNPPVQFVVQANSYAELDTMVDNLITKAKGYKGLQNIDSDLKLNKPQLKLDLKRDKIADVGSSVEAVGRTLETLLGGRQVTRFKRDGKQYDVIVQLAESERQQPHDLTAIYVRGKDGQLVQLDNLVTINETVAPKELNHFNRLRAAIISASITPGYTLEDALTFLDQAAKETLPPSAQTALDGQSREFRESSTTLAVTFLLALGFIYLVLAAQFESFVSPLVIMLTVPLAITGALLSLKFIPLSGGTLNVYSNIGLVMLVGLITKHGILIVEFANQLRARGMDKVEAIIEAATLRLRPILMTTGAMVLGAIPLALAFGAGAEARRPIGWVIVGGLMLGTFLTLFVIPAAYLLLVRKVRLEK